MPNYTGRIPNPVAHDGVKWCPYCKVEKPVEVFTKDKNAKDGYRRFCSDCAKIKWAKWANKNRDKTRSYSRRHFENNREKELERGRKIYWKNRNAYLAENPLEIRPEKTDDKWCPACKKWLSFAEFSKDKHMPDGIAGACKVCKQRWYTGWRTRPENLERVRKNAVLNDQKLRRENPAKAVIRDKKHTAQRRAAKSGNGGSFTSEEWVELCNKYGNKCLKCHKTDVKLTFDHVIPVSWPGGTSNIENGQPLCFNCNSSKGDNFIDYRPDSLNYYKYEEDELRELNRKQR